MSRPLVHCTRFVACATIWLGLLHAAAFAAEPSAIQFTPRGAIAVVTVNPAVVFADPDLGPVISGMIPPFPLEQELGVSIKSISRFTFMFEQSTPQRPLITAAIEFDRDIDWEKLFKTEKFAGVKIKVGPYQGVTSPDRDFHGVTVGPRMFVLSSTRETLNAAVAAATSDDAPAAWLQSLGALEKDVVVAAAFDHGLIAPMVQQLVEDRPHDDVVIPAAMFAPLWKNVKSSVWTFRLKPKLQLESSLTCTSTEGAADVAETLTALNILTNNLARGFLELAPQAEGPDQQLQRAAIEYGARLADALETKADGKTVTVRTSLDVAPAELIATVTKAANTARESARRMRAQNNMKQILLALHNYASVHNRFPAAVMMGPDGKTPHSWRVAILPYIEETRLYDQYKFDEPWDSENNRQILAKMPRVYADPSESADSTDACYFALTGKESFFGDPKGTRFADITDGLSNTAAVVEAKRSIPWTKPEDIVIDPAKPLPQLGGFTPGKTLLGMGDGSVRYTLDKLDEAVRRAVFTRAGGEVIQAF